MTPDPDRFPNERPPTVSKGCWIVGAVALVLPLVVVAVVFAAYQMKRVQRTAMTHQMDKAETEAAHLLHQEARSSRPEERSISIRQEDLGRYSATDFGETLSIENAVAILVDPTSTKLAREAFTKAADGLEVEWTLKVSGISRANEDQIRASLLIPYQIVSGSSTRSSYVDVEAMFAEDSYADLVDIRQGQWIPVRGKLKIDGKDLEILDPVLVGEGKEQ